MMRIDIEKYKALASRNAFGAALAEIGAEYPDLMFLAADCMGSVRGNPFASKYPERAINFGIAEANMMMAAAGMATCGKIPVASTFGVLASLRTCEMIRTGICYPRLNVKITGTGSGLAMGGGGTTHHATEDIAVLRSFANLTMLAPCDGVSTAKALAAAVEFEGPVYIRLGGMEPNVYKEDYDFQIGKANILRDGSDVTLIAVSAAVEKTLGAAEKLAAKGVSARVIDISTIKPIDRDTILKAAHETKLLVTIEDHNVVGGLGGAVAEVLAEEPLVRHRRLGLQDTFSILGSPDELLAYHGVSPEGIASSVMEWL